MRRGLALGGLALLALAILLLAMAAEQGQVSLNFFLFIPVIVATGVLGAGGGILLFAAVVMLLSSLLPVPTTGASERQDAREDREGEVKKGYGGVVLIGPIPIVFGSAKGIKVPLLIALLLALSMLGAVVIILVLLG